MRLRETAIALTCLLAPGLVPRAEAGEVKPQLALVVMLKVLTYDANFATHGEGPFLVLVPTGEGIPESGRVLTALAPVAATTLAGRKDAIEAVAADQVSELAAKKAAAVLFLVGTPLATVKAWAAAAGAQQRYSLALDPAYSTERVMLSVEDGDGRPRVVVNHAAAAQVGALLSPSVLKVARIVR